VARGVVFDRKSAERIVTQTKRGERTSARPGRRRRVITRGAGGGGAIKRAILDADLSSGSTANASLYKFTGGAFVDTGTTITVREGLGVCTDIASGTVCWVSRVAGAGYCVISANCSCNEIQRIIISGTPTGGTYTLTFDGQTTGNLNHNTTAAAVRTALEGLSNVDSGDVACTGGDHPGSFIEVEFTGQYLETDVAEMTSTSSLTGGSSPTITITTIVAGG